MDSVHVHDNVPRFGRSVSRTDTEPCPYRASELVEARRSQEREGRFCNQDVVDAPIATMGLVLNRFHKYVN